MTADSFRAHALALEGVEERAHMGHPDFRVNGRIFATLQADGARGMVQLPPEEQAALIEQAPHVFTPAAGAWGRGGSTMVVLAAAETGQVRGALTLAWEAAIAAPARRPRRRGVAE
jgi:hypothetical protein